MSFRLEVKGQGPQQYWGCCSDLCRPTERERTECLIKTKLRNIMTFQDLENITSKEVRLRALFSTNASFCHRGLEKRNCSVFPQIRNELEQHMSCNLKEYKEFIDNEMLLILGQMDKATHIFDHVYLVRTPGFLHFRLLYLRGFQPMPKYSCTDPPCFRLCSAGLRMERFQPGGAP